MATFEATESYGPPDTIYVIEGTEEGESDIVIQDDSLSARNLLDLFHDTLCEPGSYEHSLVMEQQEVEVCDWCGVGFSRHNALYQHLCFFARNVGSISAEQSLTCSFCRKKCVSKYEHLDHFMQDHREEDILVCPRCPYRSVLDVVCLKHMDQLGGEPVKKTTTGKGRKYKYIVPGEKYLKYLSTDGRNCTKCIQMFCKQTDFFNHIHSHSKKVTCNVCDLCSMATPSILLEHKLMCRPGLTEYSRNLMQGNRKRGPGLCNILLTILANPCSASNNVVTCGFLSLPPLSRKELKSIRIRKMYFSMSI